MEVRSASGIIDLSHAIWGMASIIYLEVTGKLAIIRCHVPKFKMYRYLTKLEWLSFALLPEGKEFQQFVSKVPNIVNLRCLVDEPQGDRNCLRLPRLDSLNKLERGAERLEIKFPRNLRKWSEISTIGRLERLEVLKLDSDAFKGEQWDVKDEYFQNLKLLKFYSIMELF